MKAMAKENLVNKARNLGVRASQHTAKVINQVHTFMLSYTYMYINLKDSLPKCIWDIF